MHIFLSMKCGDSSPDELEVYASTDQAHQTSAISALTASVAMEEDI